MPWGERPLFGPGAEAVSGHNELIGDSRWLAWPPGNDRVRRHHLRAAHRLRRHRRARRARPITGKGQHIDISLYETQVAQLGPVLVAAELGVETTRVGNGDANFAIHDVFACRGLDRHVAVAVRDEQSDALKAALGLAEATPEALAARLAGRDAAEAAELLQASGIAARLVFDASDTAADADFWSRGYFGIVERTDGRRLSKASTPASRPAWGSGPDVAIEESRAVGVDSAAILQELGGYTPAEVETWPSVA